MILLFSFIFSYNSFSFTIIINSSYVISRSINAWDIKVSIPFNLLLASTKILLCFFFSFLVTWKTFFIILVVKENTRVKLAFAIPAGAPISLAKEIIDTPPLVVDKTIKILSI